MVAGPSNKVKKKRNLHKRYHPKLIADKVGSAESHMTAAENPIAGTKMPLNFSEGLVSYDLKGVDWLL